MAEEKEFEEFIIGIDDSGKEIKKSDRETNGRYVRAPILDNGRS